MDNKDIFLAVLRAKISYNRQHNEPYNEQYNETISIKPFLYQIFNLFILTTTSIVSLEVKVHLSHTTSLTISQRSSLSRYTSSD